MNTRVPDESALLDNIFESPIEGLDAVYDRAGKRYGINPKLLKAQNLYEVGPNGGTRTAGDKTHIGYGQLGPEYRAKYHVIDPTDPSQTIPAQAAVLRELLDKHKGNLQSALTEYTGGPDETKWGPKTHGYAAQVLKNFPEGQGVDFEGTHDILDHVFGGPGGHSAEPKVAAAPEASSWGALPNTMNGELLGYGSEAVAGASVARDFIRDLVGGMDLHEAIKQAPFNYQMYKGDATQAKANWSKEHPGADMLTGGLGATIGTAPAIATGAGLVGAGAKGLARLAPELQPLLNFATGSIAKAPGVKNFLLRRASQVLTGAATGATAAGLQSHMSSVPLGQQIKQGAEFGGVATPLLATGIEPLLSAISHPAASAARHLRDLGVNIRAGQMPGAGPVLSSLQKLFGDGGSTGRAQLTRAAAKALGHDSPVLTSAVMQQVNGDLSNKFKQFATAAGGADLNDTVLRHDMASILQDAASSRISDDGLKDLQNVAKVIYRKGAKLDGKDYLQLTKRGGLLDRLSHHPEVGEHGIQLRDALDDSLERGVQSGFGKWVPSGSAVGAAADPGLTALQGPLAARQLGVGLPQGFDSTVKPNFTRNSGGALVPAGEAPAFPGSPNFRGPGAAAPHGDPLQGTLENGPGPAPARGMVWEYDPGAEGIIQDLRNTRARWKNMKVLEPIIDDATGHIDPSKLAARVDTSFKNINSYRSSPQQDTLDMLALGQGDNFIPSHGAPSAVGRIWDQFAKSTHGGGPAAVLAGGALALGHELPFLESNWKPVIATGVGAAGLGGLGALANAAAGSKANTERLIANVLAGRQPSAIPFVDSLMFPTIHLYNEPDDNGAKQ